MAGCDSGSPQGAEDLDGAGVEVHLDTDGVELLEGARCLVKSPGVPAEAPVVAAAGASGGCLCSASSSWPGGCCRTASWR